MWFPILFKFTLPPADIQLQATHLQYGLTFIPVLLLFSVITIILTQIALSYNWLPAWTKRITIVFNFTIEVMVELEGSHTSLDSDISPRFT